MRFHIFILRPHFDIHNYFTNIFYTFSFYAKIIKICIYTINMKYLDYNLIYLNIYTFNIRCNLMFCIK